MTVYVLTRGFDYEGETVVSVHQSEAKAIDAASTEGLIPDAERRSLTRYPRLLSDGSVYEHWWVEDEHACWGYYVRAYDVKP